jgi:hypothetical protein
MESWKIIFTIFIIIGFFATLGTGQAVFLIIPFIMTVILIIAGLRGKPKPVSTYSNSSTYSESKDSTYSDSKESTYSDPVRKNNSPWEPKRGGPFEK